MTPSPFPDQTLLDQFSTVDWKDWNRSIVEKVLKEYAVEKIAHLPRFAALHLLDMVRRKEKGIKVTVIPNTNYDGMSERNKRRLIKKHQKVIGIEGMMLDQFERLTTTDQFLFLHARIPAKTMPSDITRWFEDA